MCLFSSFAWPLMIFSACRKPWNKQCLYFSNCGHEMAGTKKAEYRFANKNCRLYCNTDLPWKMPCFKSADTEDSVESNTVHNPTKFGPGVLIKVLYDASETLPRGPTPYPLLYAFWQKKRLSKSRKNALVLWFIRIEKTVHLQRLKGEAKF